MQTEVLACNLDKVKQNALNELNCLGKSGKNHEKLNDIQIDFVIVTAISHVKFPNLL